MVMAPVTDVYAFDGAEFKAFCEYKTYVGWMDAWLDRKTGRYYRDAKNGQVRWTFAADCIFLIGFVVTRPAEEIEKIRLRYVPPDRLRMIEVNRKRVRRR